MRCMPFDVTASSLFVPFQFVNKLCECACVCCVKLYVSSFINIYVRIIK